MTDSEMPEIAVSPKPMDYISPVAGSFNMTSFFNFKPCVPPSERRLELRFYYLGHVNLCKFDPQIQSHKFN